MLNYNSNIIDEVDYYRPIKYDWNSHIVPNTEFKLAHDVALSSNNLLTEIKLTNVDYIPYEIKIDKYLHKSSLSTFIKEVTNLIKSSKLAGLYLKSNDTIYNNEDVIKSINELTCKNIFEEAFNDSFPLYNFDDIVSDVLQSYNYNLNNLDAYLFFNRLITRFQIISYLHTRIYTIKYWALFSSILFCVVLHWLVIESKKQFHQYFLIISESGYYAVLFPLVASINYLNNLIWNLNINWRYNGYEIHFQKIKTEKKITQKM